MRCSLMNVSMHAVVPFSGRCAPQRSLCRVQRAGGRRQLRLQGCDLRGRSTHPQAGRMRAHEEPLRNACTHRQACSARGPTVTMCRSTPGHPL